MISHQPGQLLGVNQLALAFLGLVAVLRVFEAQRSQPALAVVDSVPIEVNYVKRLTGISGFTQGLSQCRKSRRIENRKRRELAETFDCANKRPRAQSVINVTSAIVFGARAEKQNANGQARWPSLFRPFFGQAAADAD